MFSSIDYTKGYMSPVYKVVYNSCIEIVKKPEWYAIKVYDTMIDIRASMMYCLSVMLDQSMPLTKLVPYLTLEQMATIANELSGVKVKKSTNSRAETFDNSNMLFLYLMIEPSIDGTGVPTATWVAEAVVTALSSHSSGKSIDFVSPMEIHIALINYWVSKKIDIKKLDRLSQGKTSIMYDPKVRINSFEDSLSELNLSKEEYELAKNYILDTNISCIMSDSFYKYCDEFVSCLLDRAKNNPELDDTINQVVDKLYSEESSSKIKEYHRGILSKSRDRRYASLLLLTYSYGNGHISEDGTYQLMVYTNKLVEDNKVKLKSDKVELLGTTIKEIKQNILEDTTLAVYMTLCEGLGEAVDEIEKLSNERKSLTNSVEAEKEKSKEIRKLFREAQKEVAKLRDELKSANIRLDKLKDSATYSKEYVMGLEGKVNNLTIQIQNELEQTRLINRAVAKRDKEIASLREKLDKAESDYLDLVAENDSLKQANEGMSINRSISGIPMQCFINTLKNKKIALIGGDVMHARLPSYGLDNIRCYKAGKKSIGVEELAGMDLVVINTGILSHTIKENAMRVIKEYNIPNIMFNNQNIEMMIYEMFKELYK